MTLSVYMKDESANDAGGPVTIKTNARRTLDGNIMILDHADIDIILDVNNRKVVAFPKKLVDDVSYAAQSRMFDFLHKQGVISTETVQGGSAYGALEAVFPESNDGSDPVQVVMLSLNKFVEEERPYFQSDRIYADQEIERVTDPDDEETTELGEVPHAEEKGAMRQDFSAFRRYVSGI